MSNPTQTATLVATSGFSGHPKTFRIEYDTLASLSQSIFDLSLDTGISLDNAVITLSNGKSYQCDESGMHLCFGEGSLSIDDFVALQFYKELAV